MTWENAIEEHRKQYGRNYMVCEDEQEREFLIDLIAPLLEGYDKQQIDLVIGFACRTIVNDKCDLKIVLNCVKENIGKV